MVPEGIKPHSAKHVVYNDLQFMVLHHVNELNHKKLEKTHLVRVVCWRKSKNKCQQFCMG